VRSVVRLELQLTSKKYCAIVIIMKVGNGEDPLPWKSLMVSVCNLVSQHSIQPSRRPSNAGGVLESPSLKARETDPNKAVCLLTCSRTPEYERPPQLLQSAVILCCFGRTMISNPDATVGMRL
jgi:hypothetical protein